MINDTVRPLSPRQTLTAKAGCYKPGHLTVVIGQHSRRCLNISCVPRGRLHCSQPIYHAFGNRQHPRPQACCPGEYGVSRVLPSDYQVMQFGSLLCIEAGEMLTASMGIP